MPIISPWLIYLIGISEEVGTFLLLASASTVATYIIIALLNLIDKELLEDYIDKNKLKILRRFAIVSTVLYILLPSKEIMVAMFVADNVTYENLEIVGETIKDSVDYIFEKVNNE